MSDYYQTYLLRLWRAQRAGGWQWHASLESPSTGERRGFATLEELYTHLRVRLDELDSQLDDGEPLPGDTGSDRRGVSVELPIDPSSDAVSTFPSPAEPVEPNAPTTI
jgi:hypothetical protein